MLSDNQCVDISIFARRRCETAGSTATNLVANVYEAAVGCRTNALGSIGGNSEHITLNGLSDSHFLKSES